MSETNQIPRGSDQLQPRGGELAKDLVDMTEDQMAEFIAIDLLEIENRRYRNGSMPQSDHKILFLIGNYLNDVTTAIDIRGQKIYTKDSQFPKPPKIPEVSAAISRYFKFGRGNLPRVLSQVSDVFYNLAQLRVLDPEIANVYTEWMNKLSGGLGMESRDLLGLAIIKYRRRLIEREGAKDVPVEESIIEGFIQQEQIAGEFSVKPPTEEGLKNFYRLVNLLGQKVLAPRIAQMKVMETSIALEYSD